MSKREYSMSVMEAIIYIDQQMKEKLSIQFLGAYEIQLKPLMETMDIITELRENQVDILLEESIDKRTNNKKRKEKIDRAIRSMISVDEIYYKPEPEFEEEEEKEEIVSTLPSREENNETKQEKGGENAKDKT